MERELLHGSALPAEAQFSQVRDILVQDFNKDGIMDLALVGNDYAVRPSYGRYDASYGWCLLGNKDGNFEALMPVKSGFIVKGDARRIAPVTINGKQYIVVTVNNGNLHLFKRINDPFSVISELYTLGLDT